MCIRDSLIRVTDKPFRGDHGHLGIHTVISSFVDGKRGEIVSRFTCNHAREHRVHRRALLILAQQCAQLRIFFFQLLIKQASQHKLIILRFELIIFILNVAAQLDPVQIA